MANLGKTIDPKKVQPSGLFEPLPAGNYPVAILASEVRHNRESQGTHLALTMQVLEGQGKGRLLWHNVTLTNASDEAVRIGDEQLSAICHAVGHTAKLKNTEVLHGQPFVVRVVIDPDTGRNKVSRVLFDQKFEGATLPPVPKGVEGADGQQEVA